GEGKTVTVNGREFAGPVNVARRSNLSEVSFVGNGADDQTSASIAAGAAKEMTHMDTGTNEKVEKVEGQETTVQATEPEKPVVTAADPVADLRAQAAAEHERIAAVRKACGDAHPEICARAIREGWDVTKTELEVLRA